MNTEVILLSTDEEILNQTKQLCETLVQHPQFQSIQSRMQTFLNDDGARLQYQNLSEKGEYLQHKQEQGVQLNEDEVADYEKARDALLNNSVAKGFLDAQDEMHQVQKMVNQVVQKTFELGRVPDSEELEGSCGSGCGCH